LYSFASSSGGLEANRADETVERLGDAAVEPIEVRELLVWKRRISAEGSQWPGCERGVDAFEEFEKDSPALDGQPAPDSGRAGADVPADP